MREPDPKHVKQVTSYSLMHDLDYYIIMYQNASKQSWNMDEQELIKTPPMRCFGIHVTQEMKDDVEAHLAEAVRLANAKELPVFDVTAWTFSPFKLHTALLLTNEQLKASIDLYNSQVATMPKWMQSGCKEAYRWIKEIRERAR